MLAFHVILNRYLLPFYVSSILAILKYKNRVLSQVRTLRILEGKIEPSGLEDYNILLVDSIRGFNILPKEALEH
jgi:hypothetical protein